MKPEQPRGMGDFIVRKPRRPVRQPVASTARQAAKPVKHEAAPLEPTTLEQKIKKQRKRWKRFKLWFLDIWQPLVIVISVGLIVTTVLGFRIGGLTNNASLAEVDYIHSVDSGKKLLEHPSLMPHKLPTYLLFKADVQRIGAYRAVSAVFALAALISVFFILRRWFSLRIAILGSWLMLTSAWLLHYARLALPEASFLLLMPLLWTAAWMYHTERRQISFVILTAGSVLCFYIPAFCWLVLGAVVWQRKTILREFSNTRWWFRVVVGLMALVLFLPLIYGVIRNPNELLLLAGLPDKLPKFADIGANFVNIPLQLLLQGPDKPIAWLGRLPLLDVFSVTMFVLGGYSLRYNLKLIRTKLLIATTLLLVVFIAAGGLVTSLALLPIIYLLVSAGIAFMLLQWFTVFPRNPIARSLGTTLMSILILLVSYYHINHYFIAWPHTPATKQAFGQTLVK